MSDFREYREKLSSRRGGHYGVCLRCPKETSHPSGVCQECRKTTCKRCNKTFTPKVPDSVKCGDCKQRLGA